MSDYWWTITLRGLVAVFFGVAVFIWPDIAIQTLVILFGVFVFIDGLVNLSLAMRVSKLHDSWWVLFVQGAIGVGVGIVSFVWPAATAIALLYLVAFWAIMIGVLEIAASLRLSHERDGGWVLGSCGLGSALLGVLFLAWPEAAIHGFIWLVGACAIVFGSLLIFLGLKIKQLGLGLYDDRFTLN